MNSPFANLPKTPSAFRDKSVRELQLFYQKPIAKVSTELLITVVSVIFLAVFAIRPTLNTMSTLLKDIEDKQKVDQDLTKKAAALSTLNAEIVPLSSQLETLDKVVPNTPDLDGLLRRIEKLASNEPIVLTSVKTETVPKENDPEIQGVAQLSSYTVLLGIEGTYAEVLKYLDRLTHMDREISIETLSITAQKDLAKTNNAEASKTVAAPTLQMNVTLQAQYFGIPVEKDASTQ